ncbi:MAG: PAS domain S-box protein [Salinivirgaceae bacterium]
MKNKIRILHIDDNLLDRQMVKNILQKETDEFEVIETDNHLEFELHLTKSDFDLILSEFNIPGLEGLNVIQLVKTKKPEIPVIIVTGKGSEEIAAEAMKLGAADYVIKSEKHIQNLSPAIRKVIENRKIQDAYKATLNALRKSEERFRLLFDNSMDGVLLTQPDGVIIKANDAACNIFGRTEPELKQVGRNGILDVTDPRLAVAIQERSQKGKFEGELTGLRNDGSPFPIEISSAIFQDIDGNQRSSMVVRDITERKHAEETLVEERNLLRTLIDNLPVGIFVKDIEYRKIIANKLHISSTLKNLSALGLDPNTDLIGKTDFEVTTRELAEKYFVDDQKVVRDGEVIINKEEEETGPDGKQNWKLLTKIPFRDKEDVIIGMIGIINDITEHKQAEKEQLTLFSRYEAILASVPEIIMEVDCNKKYTWANQAGIEFFGDGVIGKEAAFYFEGEQETYKQLEPLYNRTKSIIYIESLQRRCDGEKRLLAWWCRLLEDEDGKVTGALSVAQDITDRKMADEALIASEIRYRRLFESAKDGILILDAETGMIADVNPYLVELLGYSTEQFHGKKVWEIGIFTDIIANHDKFLELQQKEYVRYDDLPLKTIDGRQISVEFISNLYLVNKKKVIQCNIRNITERKLAEKKLLESEERFRSLYENSTIGLYRTTPNGEILLANPTLVKMTGFSSFKELASKNLVKDGLLSLYERKKFLEKIEMNGEVNGHESVWLRKDGTVITINESAKAIRDSNGNTLYYDGTVEDITERKQAEVAMRLSEEKFRAIFYHASDGMFLTDVETRKFFMCNATCARMLGHTKEDFPNLNVADMHLVEDLPFVYEQIEKALKGEKSITNNIRFRRKNGDIFFADLSPALITIGDKKFLLILIKDITERKKAEEQRIVQTTALEATAVSVVITNVEGTITWVNAAFTLLTGYSKEEAIGKNPRIVKSGLHDKLFYKNMWNTIKAGNVWHNEIINKRKDGSLYTSEITITPVLDPNGKVQNYISLEQDITERKRAEEEIRNMNATLELKVEERTKKLSEANLDLKEAKVQAEHANQAKSEFLSNMSNEIRTPMNAVLGYAELLNNLLEDKAQKEYLNSIMSSGKTLLTLINDILDLSKIEAGKLELTFDFVNTHSFFSEFERIFSWKVAEKGLVFILDIVSGIPAGIYVDETRLRQIILNVIGNAVKFTQKGHVKLKVYIENPQIVKLSNKKAEEFIDLVIEIEDTGIGISSEFQEQIFEPFSQEQHKNQFGGTGLGLAISRRLLSLMNGTIQIQSALKKGTTFIIKIPNITYLRDFERPTDNFHFDPANIVFEKATILIVDDVAHNRKYIVDALKNTNIEIIEAEDGLSGYRLAKDRIPDLIISDLRMPKLDGFGFLEKILGNAKLSHIPVIAYSASAMKEQKEHVFNCNFSGLLIKPVLVTDLYIELMNYLPYTSTLVPEKDQPPRIELLNQINDIQGLIQSLETVYNIAWKKFEVIQPMGEVKQFGINMENLGKAHNAETIKKYGNELKLAADNFNIDSVLNLLYKYQNIVKEIKEYQSNN